MFVFVAGSMPDDSDLYYGFTRFAIELNELEDEQVHLYAPTDTRFRPDQRYILTTLVTGWGLGSANGLAVFVNKLQCERQYFEKCIERTWEMKMICHVLNTRPKTLFLYVV